MFFSYKICFSSRDLSLVQNGKRIRFRLDFPGYSVQSLGPSDFSISPDFSIRFVVGKKLKIIDLSAGMCCFCE